MSRQDSYSIVIRRFLNPFLTGFTTKKRSLFFNDLKRYISSGVSYYDAITTMRRYCRNGHLRTILAKMQSMVDAGRGIGDALSLFPATFTEFELAMVDLGESTGKLDLALGNVSEKLKTDHFIKKETIKGLWWPALTFMVIAAVFITLQHVGQAVPIAITPFSVVAFLIIAVGLILAVKLVRATPGIGYTFDLLFGSIPFIGGVAKKAALARFATAFSYAYSSGSDIQETLRLAGRSASNNVFAHEAERIAGEVRRGASLTEAFDKARLMPPILKQIVAVGEKTGDFDKSMMNITEFAKEEVKTAIEMMIKLGFVLSILAAGVFVFLLALSFYTEYLEKGLKILHQANPHHNR